MSRRGRGFRRASGGRGTTTLDFPLTTTSLGAWFDARTNAAGAVTSWASRGGSLGTLNFTQSTAANKPTCTTAAAFNGLNVVRFDGVNDQLVIDAPNAMKFLTDGTGASIFLVRSIDGSLAANQEVLASDTGASEIGITMTYTTAPVADMRWHNGSGTILNAYQPAGSGVRNTAAWECISYATGTMTHARSGTSGTHADTGGQTPSASNPTRSLVISSTPTSATLAPFKGDIAHLLLYTKVLSSTERNNLAAYFATLNGVAA